MEGSGLTGPATLINTHSLQERPSQARRGQARLHWVGLGWWGLEGEMDGCTRVGEAEVLLPGKRCHNPTQHTQDINTQIWDFKEPEKGRWID